MKSYSIAPEGFKFCSTPGCGKWPSTLEFFYKNKNSKDGFRCYCKICDTQLKKRYPEDPQKRKERCAKWHKKRKAINKRRKTFLRNRLNES